MAFYTDTITSHGTQRRSIFTFIANVFRRFIDAQNRSADVARMRQLNDRQLADMGLNRDDIVRHVYRDIYYI